MIEVDEHDPIREYTEDEKQRLTVQLRDATLGVSTGALLERPFDVRLIEELHRRLFEGVRDHAGRMRGRGYGSERLTFGPQRSVHRDEVERELVAVVRHVRQELHAIRDDDAAEDYELRALRLAVWAHAEIIRIHPFEDGNGRVSRLCSGHLLMQCGLMPVPIEAVKQEYTTALNEYYKTRDIEPLVDLFIELYPAGR